MHGHPCLCTKVQAIPKEGSGSPLGSHFRKKWKKAGLIGFVVPHPSTPGRLTCCSLSFIVQAQGPVIFGTFFFLILHRFGYHLRYLFGAFFGAFGGRGQIVILATPPMKNDGFGGSRVLTLESFWYTFSILLPGAHFLSFLVDLGVARAPVWEPKQTEEQPTTTQKNIRKK